MSACTCIVVVLVGWIQLHGRVAILAARCRRVRCTVGCAVPLVQRVCTCRILHAVTDSPVEDGDTSSVDEECNSKTLVR